jgi:acyl-CoA thioester hydrolase
MLRHPIRVIFGDTDQMGVVYYANYLRYFEASRAALMRHLGFAAADLERWGIGLPVIEAHCRYLRPAGYDQLIEVVVSVTKARTVSFRMDYRIERDGELLAHGYTRHACIASSSGRPTRMPPELAAAMTSALSAPTKA